VGGGWMFVGGGGGLWSLFARAAARKGGSAYA
jgi:hypothetical protein